MRSVLAAGWPSATPDDGRVGGGGKKTTLWRIVLVFEKMAFSGGGLGVHDTEDQLSPRGTPLFELRH